MKRHSGPFAFLTASFLDTFRELDSRKPGRWHHPTHIRQHWYDVEGQVQETMRDCLSWLTNIWKGYIGGCMITGAISDRVITDKFLDKLNPDIRMWVRDRRPRQF